MFRPFHPPKSRPRRPKKPVDVAAVLLDIARCNDIEALAKTLQGFFFNNIDSLASLVATVVQPKPSEQETLKAFASQLSAASAEGRSLRVRASAKDLWQQLDQQEAALDAEIGCFYHLAEHWLMFLMTPAGSVLALTWPGADSTDSAMYQLRPHRQGKAIAQVAEAAELRLADLCRFAALGRLAFVDPLTNLGNSRQLRQAVEDNIHRANRFGGGFTLLFVDLDNFKEVNDTLGHDAGDKVLIQTARCLESAVRSVDQVFRLAGDEFVIVLAGADMKTSLAVVKRLKQALGQYPAQPSCSVGIASYPRDGHTFNELLKVADQGMYRCKRGGPKSSPEGPITEL